jgi:hypothetical protein
VSDAFRLMMMRIANDKALPFKPLTPNAETIEAMKAARRGELTTAGSPDALLASLNAGDYAALRPRTLPRVIFVRGVPQLPQRQGHEQLAGGRSPMRANSPPKSSNVFATGTGRR